MDPRNGCRRMNNGQPQSREPVPELPPAPKEPAMRRWPHPVAETAPEGLEAELCSLSRVLAQQTQLLTDIRGLLEQLAERQRRTP